MFNFKLVVTGTRYGRDDVWALLDEFLAKHGVPTTLIVGDAAGVDASAIAWAKARHIPYEMFEAHWKRYGQTAGPLRNTQMIAATKAGDYCLAFPARKSAGTWDCVRKAEARGLLVTVHSLEARAPRPKQRSLF